MKVLFIHGNYPGQFRYLAQVLGANKENEVIFLTMREDAEKEKLEGVKISKFNMHRNPSENIHHYLGATEEAILKGQAVIRKIIELMEKGFIPDVVINHGGTGLGLFVKQILPNVKQIGYFEWYFRNETSKNLLSNFNLDEQITCDMRNMIILHELNSCDKAVVPTHWQHKQFPPYFNNKTEIIFDGINTKYFRDSNECEKTECENMDFIDVDNNKIFSITKEDKVLSYATRGMEPIRGFPEFMRALPKIQSEDKKVKVIIAGLDRRAYSYAAPGSEGSWKKYLLKELGNKIDLSRVCFTGLLTYENYRRLLWRSDLHCYFTRDYVTSWSLFESLACGTNLLISETEATDNIAVKDSTSWVDIDNKEEIEHMIIKYLKKENRKKGRLQKGFELEEALTKWVRLINEVSSEMV